MVAQELAEKIVQYLVNRGMAEDGTSTNDDPYQFISHDELLEIEDFCSDDLNIEFFLEDLRELYTHETFVELAQDILNRT